MDLADHILVAIGFFLKTIILYYFAIKSPHFFFCLTTFLVHCVGTDLAEDIISENQCYLRIGIGAEFFCHSIHILHINIVITMPAVALTAEQMMRAKQDFINFLHTRYSPKMFLTVRP